MDRKGRHYLTAVAVALSCLCGQAQDYTYNTDDSKRNQFTIGEQGFGDLTPDIYYKLFHSDYYDDIKDNTQRSTMNKLALRTEMYAAVYNEVPMADSIKASLEERAEIEALNMADRAADIEWANEGDKIERALSTLDMLIGKLSGYGEGTAVWQEKYDMYAFAVDMVKGSGVYLPNSERKRAYQLIYADITDANCELVDYIKRLHMQEESASLFSASDAVVIDRESCVSGCLGNWKAAALSGVSSVKK